MTKSRVRSQDSAPATEANVNPDLDLIKPEGFLNILGVGMLCFMIPPAPVFVARGICSCDFWLNCLLSSFMVFPGVIHALYIVFVVDIEKELKEKFDEKVAEKKKKGSKG